MGFFLSWLFEKRSIVSGSLAIVLFAITLVLRYGFDLWWPFGIVMATILAVVAMVLAMRE